MKIKMNKTISGIDFQHIENTIVDIDERIAQKYIEYGHAELVKTKDELKDTGLETR